MINDNIKDNENDVEEEDEYDNINHIRIGSLKINVCLSRVLHGHVHVTTPGHYNLQSSVQNNDST